MQRASSSPALLTLLLSCAAALAACGGGSGNGTGDACTGSETRCEGNEFQTCNGEEFTVTSSCAAGLTCDPNIGCAECAPSDGNFCDGDDVVSCNADGTRGGVLETCEPSLCSGGSCGGSFDDCDATGVELVYVVDTSDVMYSFDPTLLPGDPLTTIGTMACPAAPAIGGGTATPFSMSVDREGNGWVLYSSGEIFNVSVADASCTATTFAVGQQGLELFGMGFVSDSAGSNDETLFIVGGAAALAGSSNTFATVDKATRVATVIGNTPAAVRSPEFTGTGAGELWAYFPGEAGLEDSRITQIGKTDGSAVQNFNRPAPANTTAWAFAHYGGKFYIFNTSSAGSVVIEFDPAGPSESVVVPNAPVIVGAGVSTCAPIQID